MCRPAIEIFHDESIRRDRGAARGRIVVGVFQPRHGADSSGAAEVGGSRYGSTVDQHVGVHSDVHAGLVSDRTGYELVARGADDLSGQLHRPGSDDSQRTCRDAIRHTISRLLPGGIRCTWSERASADAGARCLRLVWHPDVDRRHGPIHAAGHVAACLENGTTDWWPWNYRAAGWLLSGVLAAQCYCRLARDRVDPTATEHQGATANRVWPGPSFMGICAGRRLRADALAAISVRGRATEGGAVLVVFLSGADGQCELLGHAVA